MNEPIKNKIGVVLVNLGTPDSPTYFDVARYLSEFLTDERVIDKPWIFRQLLVHGVIIPSRCRQSTAYYKKIWMKEGSPLKVYGQIVESVLQQHLGHEYIVKLAMRYQNPSIKSILDEMNKQLLTKLIFIPLFPQYASATTGSVHACIMDHLSKWDYIPDTHFISHYETHPKMIEAFCFAANAFKISNYDHILFSFHGLPQRHVLKTDLKKVCLTKNCCQTLSEKNSSCYSAQCHATAYAIANKLKIDKSQFSIAFQSRLGKEPWLQPYTGETLHALASSGNKRVLVFCPSFVCDCLETTHEIGIEYELEFRQAGGDCLDLVPGLNASPVWIEALENMVLSII